MGTHDSSVTPISTKTMRTKDLSTMTMSTEDLEDISNNLEGTKNVVLHGVSGVGKTWTARKVSEFAIEKRSFGVALWFSRNYDEEAMREVIARQLDPLPTAEDWEVASDIEKKPKANSDKEGEGDNVKKEAKHEKGTSLHFQDMIAKFCGTEKDKTKIPNVLIILDDVPSTTEEQKIIKSVEELLPGCSLKFLITRVKEVNVQEKSSEATSVKEDLPSEKEGAQSEIQEQNDSPGKEASGEVNGQSRDEKEFELKPWNEDESLQFLRGKIGEEVYAVQLITKLAEEFIKTMALKTIGCVPAKIISLAKAFKYFYKKDYETRITHLAEDDALKEGRKCIENLENSYYMLPRSIVVDCSRWQPDGKGSHFFLNRGSIHYTELIAYWIMEGYLESAGSIAKAYQEGHSILMELVDSQVLKTLDSGYVIMDKPIDFDDSGNRYGFGAIPSLGLAYLSDLEKYKWEGFGTLAQTDKTIRSIQTSEEDEEIFTLILSGNRCEKILTILEVLKEKQAKKRIRQEAEKNKEQPTENNLPETEEEKKQPATSKPPETEEEKKQPATDKPPETVVKKDELPVRVLALLNPNLTSLALPSDMNKLAVLVLRSCVFLKTIHPIHHEFSPGNLTVLEISNATSLTDIADDFFASMGLLQSLHLSELVVKWLPSTLYKLNELRWLILRGCSNLEKLDSLKLMKKLLVLEVSGATSLQRFRDKTFQHHPDLQVLNVSHSGIDRLPKFRNSSKLTHLIVSGCKNLTRLPKTVALNSLQTFDVSGCSQIEEFHEESLEKADELNIVDLSETFLDTVLPMINPRQLILKCCSRLKVLPPLERLEKLEVLDVSGTKSLVEIEESFFTKLSSLQTLNLSETGIKDLPLLSNNRKIRRLLLSGLALTIKENHSFEHFSSLEHLDLSYSEIERVPSLSNLSRLAFLSLKSCCQLKSLPALETLTSLEELNLSGISCLGEAETGSLRVMKRLRILDLSETRIQKLTSLSDLINLQKLFLRDCTDLQTVRDLEKLTTLEVLDISGTKVTEPEELKKSGKLKQLLVRSSSQLDEFLKLEVTRVSGSAPNEAPQETSKLNRVEFLDLPAITEGAGSSTSPSKKPESHKWSISNFNKPSRFVSALKLHEILKNDSSLLDTTFKQFHLCIHPTTRQSESGFTDLNSDDIMYNDIRFSCANFGNAEGAKSLEIHGFDSLPEDVEELLCKSEYVFLVGNSFKKWSCGKRLEGMKMKGCWIEKCTELEDVSSSVQEGSIATVAKNLETLGISNAVRLKNLHCVGFKKLTSLYLDCCPELSTVYWSPELSKHLKILHVKFCDKLTSLFSKVSQEPKSKSAVEEASPEAKLKSPVEEASPQAKLKSPVEEASPQAKLKSPVEEASPELVLQNLKTLYLLELPELESIGCKLPPLEKFQAWECPKLKIEDPEIIKSHPSHKEVKGLLHSCYCSECNKSSQRRICPEYSPPKLPATSSAVGEAAPSTSSVPNPVNQTILRTRA